MASAGVRLPGAVGAGLQVVAETVDRHGSLSGRAASLTLAVLAAVATPPLLLALTVALIGLIVAGLVAADLVRPPRRRT